MRPDFFAAAGGGRPEARESVPGGITLQIAPSPETAKAQEHEPSTRRAATSALRTAPSVFAQST